LFPSPDLLHSIRSHSCVKTIYRTSEAHRVTTACCARGPQTW
jgi:hypothetical protein